jgi:hypothetical protein
VGKNNKHIDKKKGATFVTPFFMSWEKLLART